MKDDRNGTPPMMREMPGDTIAAYAELFPGAQFKLVLASIAAGNTTARFVAECLRRGKQPFWECAAGNLASARVAEKAGFELLEQTRFLAGSFAL